MAKKSFRVDSEERLDKKLAELLSCSRNQAEQLINDSLVSVNGVRVTKRGFALSEDDEISVELPEQKSTHDGFEDVDFDVTVLYEDEDILVINKPSNLVVHKAPSVKEQTLVDWLVAKGFTLSRLNGTERPGIVHRLDKDTTGAMVVAKSDRAHAGLSAQLKTRSMGRIYLALIDMPLKENMTVEKPIARNPKNRLKMGIVEGGREAKSHFAKLALSTEGNHELIAAKLHSGRTHQIRVHLASINRHILGDFLYGFKNKQGTFTRVMLHSKYLYLKHPVTHEGMVFAADIFGDFGKILTDKFNHKEVYEKTDYGFLCDIFSSF